MSTRAERERAAWEGLAKELMALGRSVAQDQKGAIVRVGAESGRKVDTGYVIRLREVLPDGPWSTKPPPEGRKMYFSIRSDGGREVTKVFREKRGGFCFPEIAGTVYRYVDLIADREAREEERGKARDASERMLARFRDSEHPFDRSFAECVRVDDDGTFEFRAKLSSEDLSGLARFFYGMGR